MLGGAMRMEAETFPVAISPNFATAHVEKAVAVVSVLIAIAAGALMVLRKMTVRRGVV
jgi:ABC-type sulfate transport system permease component